MRENRGAWYLLTGLVTGIVIGLVVSIWVLPAEFARTSPQALGEDYKAVYRGLIALSYSANGDIGRARARISLLQDVNPAAVFSAQAQRQLTEGGDLDKLGRGHLWKGEIPGCLHQNHIFAVRCFRHKLKP